MTDRFHVSYAPAALNDLKTVFSYIAYNLKARQAAVSQTNRIRNQIRSH